jgi:hypothetical protein
MHRKNLATLTVVALCVVAIGALLTGLSLVSMRVAHHRAYVEIATTCARASLLTVENSRFFCAPVARVESDATSAAPGELSPVPSTPL